MSEDDITLTNRQQAEQIDQLNQELEEEARRAEECQERLKYLQADFDNYRKWFEKEKGAIITFANEHLITDLLVILDDFERALPALDTEKNSEGMRMVYSKIIKILAGYGLQPIECVGKKFDPAVHEALCREQSDVEPETVIEEIGKGYRLKSKVIRPSKVKIAEQPAER
ncbi:MAG: molecular chaperone GrpE [Methanoculleus sp. SDB]|nr:MAG: molecular chaperone GrpE [Methanoculleus sp. SDB]